MSTLKFKTNINCGGCIEKVTPFLNNEPNINTWEVDTTNPQKILEVDTECMKAAELISLLSRAGFKADPIGE
jgi:copper chaperone